MLYSRGLLTFSEPGTALFLNRILALLMAGLLSSCTTTGSTEFQRQTAETQYLDRLVLSEVSFILTKDQLVAGELGFARFKDFYGAVLAEGLTDAEIDAGQVIAIRWSVFWVNTASGNTHHRLGVALLPNGMKAEPGNIVEVRYLGSLHFPRVESVRAKNMRDGQCQYVESLDRLPLQMTKDILGLVSLIGTPGTSTLYCQGIENEGWVLEGQHWVKKPRPASKLKSDSEVNHGQLP